jgi:hypothetical protein
MSPNRADGSGGEGIRLRRSPSSAVAAQVIPAWEPTPQPRTSTPFPDQSVIVPIRFFLDSGISNVYTDHEIYDLS